MDSTTSTEAVKGLLTAAHLTVSDEEFERIVSVYPTIRAQADELYLPELEMEDPALSFDPAARYA
ncbi:hypothetical protein ABN034_28970 [Actinopolymorpha sp. B11F2]|uniref:hypothetical protein n=1 Tax=Actinopolymorpha sp. B11F2 TaxID=3160862 RepID=UPI0032E36DE4